VLVAIVLASLYFSAILFLAPIWTQGQVGKQYNSDISLNLVAGSVQVEVSVYTELDLVDFPSDFQGYLVAGFLHAPRGHPNSSTVCVDGYHYDSHGNVCMDLKNERLKKLDSNNNNNRRGQFESENTALSAGYFGPTDSHEQFEAFDFTIPEDQVDGDVLFLRLYRLGEPDNAGNCRSFNNTQGIRYVGGTLQKDYYPLDNGCAQQFEFADTSTCPFAEFVFHSFFSTANTYLVGRENCTFLVTYSVFRNVPLIFSMPSIFQWGSFVALGLCMVFFAVSYTLVRKVHRSYKKLYYHTSENVSFVANVTYDYKLILTGVEMTTEDGEFLLINDEIIAHRREFQATFGPEDVADSHRSSMMIRGKLSFAQDLENASFSVLWQREYELSNFTRPTAHICIRRSLSNALKNPFTAIFAGLSLPKILYEHFTHRYRLIYPWDFAYFVILSILRVLPLPFLVIYAVIAYIIPSDLLWRTDAGNVVAIVCYLIYTAILVTFTVLVFVPLARRREKLNKLHRDDYFRSASVLKKQLGLQRVESQSAANRKESNLSIGHNLQTEYYAMTDFGTENDEHQDIDVLSQ